MMTWPQSSCVCWKWTCDFHHFAWCYWLAAGSACTYSSSVWVTTRMKDLTTIGRRWHIFNGRGPARSVPNIIITRGPQCVHRSIGRPVIIGETHRCDQQQMSPAVFLYPHISRLLRMLASVTTIKWIFVLCWTGHGHDGHKGAVWCCVIG